MANPDISEYYQLHFWANRLYEEYAKQIGESVTVVFLMRLLLDEREPLCQRSLCSNLAVPKASMSRILSDLAERNIVSCKVSRADGREKHYFLTESGIAFAVSIVGKLESIEAACTNKLKKGDMREVNRFNRKFLSAFQEALNELEKED